MEPDEEGCLIDSKRKVFGCFITDSEGNKIKIGNVLDASAEIVSEKSEEVGIGLGTSFSGTIRFKMSSIYSRRWKVFATTTIENAKLNRIMKRVKKGRAKKKLLGRIYRNIYKQIECGL